MIWGYLYFRKPPYLHYWNCKSSENWTFFLYAHDLISMCHEKNPSGTDFMDVNGMILDCTGHVCLYSLGQFHTPEPLTWWLGTPRFSNRKSSKIPVGFFKTHWHTWMFLVLALTFSWSPLMHFLHHIFEKNMPKKTVTWDMPHPCYYKWGQ